jgi:hypothetical protein
MARCVSGCAKLQCIVAQLSGLLPAKGHRIVIETTLSDKKIKLRHYHELLQDLSRRPVRASQHTLSALTRDTQYDTYKRGPASSVDGKGAALTCFGAIRVHFDANCVLKQYQRSIPVEIQTGDITGKYYLPKVLHVEK